MWVVIVVVERPVPRVHEVHHREVHVPKLLGKGLHQRRMLLVRAEDGVSFIEDFMRVVVGAETHGNKDQNNTDNGGNVQAQTAPKGRRRHSSQCLLPGASTDHLQRLV